VQEEKNGGAERRVLQPFIANWERVGLKPISYLTREDALRLSFFVFYFIFVVLLKHFVQLFIFK